MKLEDITVRFDLSVYSNVELLHRHQTSSPLISMGEMIIYVVILYVEYHKET
jgi:hypothetical protein